ncbi:GvpL/GvpF family gas vesicle protein [Methylohalobius crimeensis]|uniref:GvpL/GvpF family gas vesicle protein n=1 Tax=Methylohalobius crimeensis TaxID=244365 RepID=UPI0003B45834|nr:GvpL/GvpF family gas vesicle protein [Methylohalobius crimeensis]
MEKIALYLYCLTPANNLDVLKELELPKLLGPICGEEVNGVGAVVSPVTDMSSWQDGARLNSLDWVTPRVLHHARVIERFWREAPVYPSGFGTLFSSRNRLRLLIEGHKMVLEDFFAATGGMAEWDIKIFFDPRHAEECWKAEQLRKKAEFSGLPAGRRYLAEQYLRKESQQGAVARLETLSRQWAVRLAQEGEGFRERPLPPAQESRRQAVGHWAVLWPERASNLVDLMEQAAAEFQSVGADLQWSGPWPPYSFRPVLETDG